MIDAEFRSEERFSRLALAYETTEEKDSICSCIDSMVHKYDVKPETYTTTVSNGKEVLVIEYHDENCREAGTIFEDIIQVLDIKECH